VIILGRAPDRATDDLAFLNGGGELGSLIRARDWSQTSLGPISGWPQSLKTVTSMLLLSAIPIVLLWGEDGVMIYNDAYSVFAGGRHPQLLGSRVREGWDEIAEFNDNVMRVGLAGGTLAYRNQELTLHRHGRPEQVWMNLDYSPVLDESGRPGGVIAIVVETTEGVIAERRLRESEERLRALVNATSDVVYRISPDWTEMRRLDGRGFLSDTETPSVAWMEEYLFPEDRQRVLDAAQEAIRRRSPFQLEHRVRRVDGSAGWTFSRAIPLLDADGEIVEWFGAASDITERRRVEDHLRLVVNELNHRVKNNLAMTQAIAMQTFRDGSDIVEARERFAARMVALGQATDLLTGERWAGASLRGVIEQAVLPNAPDGRCEITGPDANLTPKTALALTLALHELVTNATKYGAWSDDKGRVTISADIQERDGTRLALEWRESGGPECKPPKRRGFGSRLIERGLAGEMRADVSIAFAPTGLVCAIDAPLEQ
jgi:two-component sensor histidine kinase/PAS domain-containing protein